jgi:hypothetical protein
MKMKKMIAFAILSVAIVVGGILLAADHIDAPAVKGQSTDITDLYVFQGADANNLVFVANTQGLLAPSATGAAAFDPNTLIEIKIDNNNDNVEDLVIQAIYKDGKINIYGPVAPSLSGTIVKAEGAITASAAVTAYGASTPTIGTGGSGIKVFAGPRDDPFFFDLDQFKSIIAGTATAFNNPGHDTFAGTNVLSIVVEVPKALLNASSGKINVWLTTNKKI